MALQTTQTLDPRQCPESPVSESGESRRAERRRRLRDQRGTKPHVPRSREPSPEDAAVFSEMADHEAVNELQRNRHRLLRSDDYADTVSLAWETCRRTGRPWGCTMFRSWQRLRSLGPRSIFDESTFSITSRTQAKIPRPKYRGHPSANLRDRCHDPARICAVRIDLTEWMCHLPDRRRYILRRIAEGYTHQEIADWLGVSDSLIEQEVKNARRSWQHFCSLADRQ